MVEAASESDAKTKVHQDYVTDDDREEISEVGHFRNSMSDSPLGDKVVK